MYIYKGFITKHKINTDYQIFYVKPENKNDMEKCFDNILIPWEIFETLKTNTPILLVLEYKDSSLPVALSIDGTQYFKSKTKAPRTKTKSFRAIKNEFHNIIDLKKNKNKILKSFLIPFYSNLILYPYYFILLGFYSFFFSSIYLNSYISNIEFVFYVVLSTYLSSLILISFNIFNIKNMYNNGRKWIKELKN